MTPSPTPQEVLDESRVTCFALLRMQACTQDAAHLQSVQMLAIEREKARVRFMHQIEDGTLVPVDLVAFCQGMQDLMKQTDAFCPECKGHLQQVLRQADFFETYTVQFPDTLQQQS